MIDRPRSRAGIGAPASRSEAASGIGEWIGASPDRRGEALRELLDLADALPPPLLPEEDGLSGKILAVHEALEVARIPHAFGGAVALAYYGEPRMTTYIDVFFSRDSLHDKMSDAARQVPFAGASIPIVSPEHLAIRKALLDRPKDWLDIEQILVATSPLDLAEIEAWLQALAGEDNPRMKRLREITVALAIDG